MKIKNVSLNPLPSKSIWDKLQEHVFVETLCNMKGEIEEFIVSERGNSSEDVNLASVKLNEIITMAAESALRKKVFFKSKQKRKRRTNYFEIDCDKAAREL